MASSIKITTIVFVFVTSLCIHTSNSFPAHEDSTHRPQYNFQYAVHDVTSKDVKRHNERRDGDRVEGEYSVLEADGTTRTVRYHVTGKSGFIATVHRSGHAKHPPTPKTHKKKSNDYKKLSNHALSQFQIYQQSHEPALHHSHQHIHQETAPQQQIQYQEVPQHEEQHHHVPHYSEATDEELALHQQLHEQQDQQHAGPTDAQLQLQYEAAAQYQAAAQYAAQQAQLAQYASHNSHHIQQQYAPQHLQYVPQQHAVSYEQNQVDQQGETPQVIHYYSAHGQHHAMAMEQPQHQPQVYAHEYVNQHIQNNPQSEAYLLAQHYGMQNTPPQQNSQPQPVKSHYKRSGLFRPYI